MLQVIKAKKVRDGEPRWWCDSESAAKHALPQIDSGRFKMHRYTCDELQISQQPFAIVDRSAPTPTAPGVDLEVAEKRAAGFRGTFRVMPYDSGDEVLEYLDADADLADLDTDDVHEIAQFACDDEVQRAIVDTLNAAPALIAEVRALRAETSDLHHDIDALRRLLAEAKQLGMEACALAKGMTDLSRAAGGDDEIAAIAAALEAL